MVAPVPPISSSSPIVRVGRKAAFVVSITSAIMRLTLIVLSILMLGNLFAAGIGPALATSAVGVVILVSGVLNFLFVRKKNRPFKLTASKIFSLGLALLLGASLITLGSLHGCSVINVRILGLGAITATIIYIPAHFLEEIVVRTLKERFMSSDERLKRLWERDAELARRGINHTAAPYSPDAFIVKE